MKKIRYALEAILLQLLFIFFKVLDVKTASRIGGWLGRDIGSRLGASRKAYKNIQRALPDLNEQEQRKIVEGMWEHLGRMIAEYPHLKTLAKHHTSVINGHYWEDLLKKDQNAVFFSAHLGNFELNGPAMYMQYGKSMHVSYRAPNNPWVTKMLSHARNIDNALPAHAKSREGGRDMMNAVKAGHSLGILIDQKYNQGLAVPFFGVEAMTNPFFVQLAQKYKCALIPARNTRLDGVEFSITLYKPLELFDSKGSPRLVEDIIKDAHALLEEWIKDTPEQWLWLHRRWPD